MHWLDMLKFILHLVLSVVQCEHTSTWRFILQLNGYMDPAFQDDEAITRLFTIAPVNTFGNITYLWLDVSVLDFALGVVMIR